METAANYDGDYIDIGIFGADSEDENGRTKTNPLYMRKHKMTAGAHTLEIRVTKMPVKAGIDPYNKLIDRIPDDNLISVDID
ncbi:MAG: ABC-2 type transport system permease protein [Marivirga sp.]|jgi:ABC-2 type transport system permease protein